MNAPAACDGPRIDPKRYPPSIGAFLHERIRAWPDGEFVEVSLKRQVKRVSFAALWEKALAIREDLYQRWPEPVPVCPSTQSLGDRVAISWACLLGGYPLVIAPREWPESRLPPGTEVYSFGMSDPSPVDTSFEDRTATDPEQIALYVLTSGTTGQSRFACFPERALRYQYCARTTIPGGSAQGNHTPEILTDVHLSLFPWHSVAGMRRALFPRVPRQVFLEPDVLMAHPDQVLELMERERIRGVSLSTTFAEVLLNLLESSDRQWDLSALKYVGLGAEPIVPAVFQKLTQRLADQCQAKPQVVPGYGMTETSVLCSALNDPETLSCWMQEDPPVSVGLPTEGWRFRVVDDNDQLLHEGEEGHLQVKSSVKEFAGYLDEPPDSYETHTPGGWFRTGDLGWIREGRVWVSGRAKETLIIHGVKYPPQSIERALYDVPGVLHQQVYACRVRSADAYTDALGIFFVPDPAHPTETTEQALRARVAEEFQLSVQHLHPIAAKDLPRTATGKLQRNTLGASALLSELPLNPAPEQVESVAPRTPNEHTLAVLWKEVLLLTTPPGIHDNFFALGGHSLLSATLISRIDAQFGQPVSLHRFFQQPTIAGLAALLEESPTDASAAPGETRVSPPRRFLEPDLFFQLMSFAGSWRGERAGPESLIFGHNGSGSRPPLFWVFQGEREMRNLATALGSDQPLYGMRSGFKVMENTEDNIQALALDYMREIEALRPDGPLIIGGNCQGAQIALAIAQHLMRRRRHIPLLILMEWSFPAQPYAGPVGLIFGRESEDANPYWYFPHPERMWQRCWPCHQVEMVSGLHGQFFHESSVGDLAGVVRRLMDESLEMPVRFFPAGALCATLEVPDPPLRMRAGEQKRVSVQVTNDSTLDWPDGQTFGLTLVTQWLDLKGNLLVRLDGSVSLPALSAGATAEVAIDLCAPLQPGACHMAVRVVEEAVRQRLRDPGVLRLPVQVDADP